MSYLNPGSSIPSGNPEERRRAHTSWLDRYRPKALDEMALDSSVRVQVEQLMNQPRLPNHVVLHGPPGTGKTTLADLLVKRFFPTHQKEHVRKVNASARRGLDDIRGGLMDWMEARGGLLRVCGEDWWGIVAFSEADGLTPQAQDALKDALDHYSRTTKFIFTTNDLELLNPAIQSRCDVIEVNSPPADERARILRRILSAEHQQVEADLLIGFATEISDMRQLIRAAETSMGIHGTLLLPSRIATPSAQLWPAPVNGEGLMRDLVACFDRYLALPNDASTILALWTLFAHAHEAFQVSPLLIVTSPVKRSGKTTLLTLLSALVPKPLMTSSATAAVLCRIIDEGGCTLIADEADTWISTDDGIRRVFNAGDSRHNSHVHRVVGGGVKRYSTWCPKVIALIRKYRDDLPATIEDRGIVLPIRRRRPEERVERLRFARIHDDLRPLKSQAARWVNDHLATIQAFEPCDVPGDENDRAKERFEVLLSIADTAGGEWPARARRSLREAGRQEWEGDERGILLLGDLRSLFRDLEDRKLPSAVIVDHLCEAEDRPWRGWLTPQRLADLLRPFDVLPRPLWAVSDDGTGRTLRGYFLADLEDVFQRYLPRERQNPEV